MNVYIGLDVSLQHTHICIVSSDGDVLHEGKALSEPHALDAYLREKTHDYKVKSVILETGPLSTSLTHGLKATGWAVICIDARHAHGVLQSQRVKTDRNDARGLAQMARTGWHKRTHVKSEACLSQRLLLQGRKQLVRQRCDLENHMRGVLKTFGIKLGVTTANNFHDKVQDALEGCNKLIRSTISALLTARASLRAQESLLDKQCKQAANEDPVCQRFMTVPGVGPLTALNFKTEIDDPTRFAKSRDVGVHLGLTPRRYASGEIDRSGRISKCGSTSTRSALYEAALSLLTRSQKWSHLKAWGVALAQRSSFKGAIVAVARKLAVILHHLWVDGTEFKYGKEPAMQTA